jgi:hypothetical protein
MEKVTYQCTLLSDIILSSNSATEEAQEALDYIPGSKFLGIVANQFLKNSAPEANEEFTKLFLSDKVRFGNAYPLINNQPSFPIPLCWYDDKNKKDPNIYQIHQVSNTKKRELIQKGTQLKQRRKGYFNLAFEELNEMNQKLLKFSEQRHLVLLKGAGYNYYQQQRITFVMGRQNKRSMILRYVINKSFHQHNSYEHFVIFQRQTYWL